ncbi:hypothetical protein OS493_003669 [Desmophyllum pertusum]|uniref:Uncharacterized protein n=1 Tax=Desmophyllum pertusum TaxID=174260 RepID=A0A9X0A6G2_9CNID|nr:hypothetical protein OS493_003669 [Desmophyllum pertusum]
MRWTTSNEFSEEFCQFVAPSNNYKSKLITSTPAMFITNYYFHKLVFVICLNPRIRRGATRVEIPRDRTGPSRPLLLLIALLSEPSETLEQFVGRNRPRRS